MALDVKLTSHVLNDLLRYEESTGHLFWKLRPRCYFKTDGEQIRWNSRYAGRRAFRLRPNGYRGGYVMRQMRSEHRVVWIMHGNDPSTPFLDHINGVRDDNRLENLRSVTKQENCRNSKRSSANKSGFTGVSMHGKKWVAYIRDGGRHIYLGIFPTAEEAATVRKGAERAIGYHPNHGRVME